MSVEISAQETQEPSPSRRPNGWKRLSSEAALILLATAVVYFGAYIYEMAYLSYFRIPWDFAETSPTLLSVAGVGFLVFAVLCVRWLFLLRDFALVFGHGQWIQFCILLLVCVGWSTEFSRGEGYTSRAWALLVGLLFAGCFVLWVVPEILTILLCKFAKMKRVAAFFSVTPAVQHTLARDKKLPVEILSCVLVVSAAWALCTMMGLHNAKTLSEHYTYEEDLILIRRYGAHMICKPVNREARTFDSRFAVIPLTDKWSTFKLEKIGKLTYAPDPQ